MDNDPYHGYLMELPLTLKHGSCGVTLSKEKGSRIEVGRDYLFQAIRKTYRYCLGVPGAKGGRFDLTLPGGDVVMWISVHPPPARRGCCFGEEGNNETVVIQEPAVIQ